MPEILIINFAKGASQSQRELTVGYVGAVKLVNGEISKCRGLRGSEDIGEVRKRGGRLFGEKRV